MTRFTTTSLAMLAMIFLATAPLAAERHSKVDLVPVGDSGVTGFVQLSQSSPGSTSFHVMAKGLRPGTTYGLFSGRGDCSAPADLLGNLTGNKGGVDQFKGEINLDFSRIGSVSIRLGPGFGTLVACSLAPATIAPTVSSTVPADAATSVSISGKLSATFSEAMDPLTITTTSFTLKQGVTPIAGTVSYIGVTATFAPAVNLAPLTTYTATITTAARDLAGNPLATNFVWSFTAGVTPDIIAPTVSSTVPVNAATGVSLTGKLTATFSEAMDPLTITTTTFTLKHGNIGVAGAVSYTGVTATFTAVGPLQPLTAYTATITTAATDLAGNALVTNYSWFFTTGVAPDISAPTVSSTVPVNAATGVALNEKLTATFSEAMDPLTITTTSFTLKHGTIGVAGTVTYAGVTATFTAVGPLQPLTVYTATITTAATDLAGNALVTNYSWFFTTGSLPDITAPTVSSTVPSNGRTFVPLGTKLAATFSEAMDPLTISTASFTLKQGATPVAGTVSYAGVTATFTPTSTLAPLTVYTATITTAATDLAGNALATNYSWTFTTGLAPDVTGPIVTATVPVNAATGVAISAKLTAAFSEAMDPLTISTTSFTLKQGVTPIVGAVSYAGVTATFTPTANLAPNTFYTATITTTARDLAGNPLVTDFNWSFTTGSIPDIIAPTVIATVPVNAATAVGINQTVNATFSEAMDPLTITTASVTLTGPGATSVTGTVGYDVVSKIATFTPGANLAALTVYTATITTAAKDLAGNALAANFVWSFTTAGTAAGQAPVVLGSATTFVVLGGSTVTNTGLSIINGDLGLSPGTAVTGFPPGIVNGTIHAADPTAAQAQLDLTAAYNDAAGRTVGAITVAGNLGGQTLTPGLYTSTSTLAISSGDLTLDAQGDPNAVFIFQMGSTFTSTVGRQIILAGGAKAANIFWQVGSSATLGTGSVFKGNILALASITVTNGAAVEGRLLARTGAVTLDANGVGLAVPADITPPTVSSTVPVNAATGVSLIGILTATFSETMDPLTIATASFTLKQGVTPIAGTVGYAGVTATFTPASSLAALTVYTATITTAAKDLAGNALAANFVWSFTTGATAAGQAPVVLGSSATFAVLGGSTVTNTGASIVNGDLGLSPGTAVTGFPPGIVNGTIHAADPTAAQAQLDLTAAYNDAAGRTVGAITVAGNLGGQTLAPGLYKSTSTLAISSGDLTLDAQGDANAVFIFQMGSTFTSTAARQIILVGGAKAANIFWQVGSSATLGAGSVFKGNILALASITAGTGAAVEGRLLARTAAVTLDANVVGVAASADITAPTVSATVPVNAATGVVISGKLTAAFSEAMDPLTITTASFTLKQGVTPIAGTVSYTGVTATFTPTSTLAPLTVYTATITTAAKDLAGNALVTNFVWSFTTGVTADVTAPTVSATVPVNAATGVAISAKLTAAFSEAMDPLTITTASFTLKQGVTPIAGTVSYIGVTATFTPAGNLAPLTAYTATITTAAKDLAGNALVANFNWGFTTGSIPDIIAPTVIATVPVNAATAVGINQTVNATFSEAMDPLTITTASVTLTGPGAISVTGTVGYDVVSKIATFTPGANLAALTVYTATITTAAKDLAGNALAANFVWSFTTAGTAAGQAPVVLGSATTFVVLGGSTVTNTGLSILNGDLGLSPGTAVTGFPPGIVNGTIHAADPTAAQAQLDLTAAYNDAAGRTVGAITVAGNLGGQTLAPGLYKSTSTLAISSGDLTLDAQGDANAVFIFQMGSTFTSTAARQIILVGGAKAANIFWQVGSSATLGAGSVFKGNILALASITAGTGAAIEGRLLARTAAVTLDANVVGVAASADITAPTVSSTVPVNAATGVVISGKLTAAFSEAMDPLTITTASFTLKQGVTPIAGTVSYTGVTATFTPTSTLAPLTVYTATITTAAKDLAGNALVTNFVWSFTTGVTADVTAPTVSATVPVNAATGVAISAKLTAAFSEAMDPLTITTASFTLKQGVTPIAGTVSYIGVTATFTPAGNLAPLTAYTATITTAAKDLAGNALVANFNWGFTTGSIPDIIAPTVIATVPVNAATAVGINQTVNATFSEAMDPLTITTASVTLTGPGATSVTGTVGYDVVSKIATFTPGANLAALTVYTATITTAAKDLAGNALAANFVWSFTTAGTAAGQAPVVLGSATTFVVLGGSTVTNTGLSILNGDLGLSPGTAVTGFPPGIVNGTIHAADPTAAQAQLDLTAAYNDAAGRTVGAITVAGNLGGQTLAPGLYKSTSTLAISSGDLTLDAQGDANAVFIFQMGSTFTSTAARQIILVGGAKAANIFWQVGSSATLGAGSVFKGNILAMASITAGTGAAIEGRLLARTAAVTLDANVIGTPAAASASAPAAVQGSGTTAAPTAEANSWTTVVPNRFSFSSNPLMSGPATVRFGLSRADRVEIRIYDVSGRVVRALVNGGFDAGEHEVVWDRLDSSGSPVSSGLYFTRVTYSNQGFVAIKKLTIIE